MSARPAFAIPPSSSDKMSEIAALLVRVDDAERLIRAARKSAIGEFDERLRKLKQIGEQLYVVRSDNGQLELFHPAKVLDPGLESLLEAPLRGLD